MAIKESLAVMTASAAVAGGLAELPTTVEAHQGPEAVAARTTWSHLGGDPLVPGGIHSRHDFVRFVTSSKGHRALELQGLNDKEISALDKAAHMGKERSCTMHVGDHFKSMVFGINGTSLDRDVTFTDPRYRGRGAAAWCLDAAIKNKNGSKDVIHTLTPQKCGNLALEKIVHFKPKHKPVKQAIERVFKIAEDDQGHQLPETPTGTFRFMIQCLAKGHKLQKEVIYNQTPQELAKCDVGKPATVTELSTLGNEQWKTLSPTTQTQIVRINGNLFTFKDQELTPVPPTPPEKPKPNLPPQTQLVGPQHVKVGGEVQICEYESDPENDIVDREFKEAGNGNFISFPYKGDEAGEWCIDFKAGTTADSETVTITVRDSVSNTATDSETFPIDDSDLGEF